MKNTPQQLHIPVLVDEVVRFLAPGKGDSYLDLTAGYGGHARAIIERTAAPDQATLVDRDENAISELNFQCGFTNGGTRLVHSDFLSAAKNLHDEGRRFDMILLDIGVSSPQLDRAERGFSFMNDGELDMRMDQATGRTAAEIVNRSSEKDLRDIIVQHGEESPKTAQKIAHAIRLNRPINTTGELAKTIEKVLPRTGKIHPATRTFQALRIVVNDELRQLEQTLPIAMELLNSGGRLVVVSFHSLEDRIVKRFMNEHAHVGFESELDLLTKKPITASSDELAYNPRARSAKLRAAVKK
ncbi:MAG: 16S rRNA (cytosine(1402)-N(4))-methyltransferase RsmH [Candidatus Nomurabacteria bacterium]|jgi:16S rRNA (cytosine1402-N4)-methyltransferase|nr:16S rRNA (cytosine(1402)-N(4))-methyltransferase RsmH [Candidatus Nomurabacteria bacterium]